MPDIVNGRFISKSVQGLDTKVPCSPVKVSRRFKGRRRRPILDRLKVRPADLTEHPGSVVLLLGQPEVAHKRADKGGSWTGLDSN